MLALTFLFTGLAQTTPADEANCNVTANIVLMLDISGSMKSNKSHRLVFEFIERFMADLEAKRVEASGLGERLDVAVVAFGDPVDDTQTKVMKRFGFRTDKGTLLTLRNFNNATNLTGTWEDLRRLRSAMDKGLYTLGDTESGLRVAGRSIKDVSTDTSFDAILMVTDGSPTRRNLSNYKKPIFSRSGSEILAAELRQENVTVYTVYLTTGKKKHYKTNSEWLRDKIAFDNTTAFMNISTSNVGFVELALNATRKVLASICRKGERAYFQLIENPLERTRDQSTTAVVKPGILKANGGFKPWQIVAMALAVVGLIFLAGCATVLVLTRKAKGKAGVIQPTAKDKEVAADVP